MVSIEMASHQLEAKLASLQVDPEPDPLDFDECLKDSPKFRQCLKDNLSNVENLEHYMSKTIKQVGNYIDTGREHIKSQKDFVNSMKTLNGVVGPSNVETYKRVNTLLSALDELGRLYEIVIDQSARTIGNSLSQFINNDLTKLKEARKSFDKISHEYDLALTKYSQPVKKQQEDSENLLIATSTAFTHTSLDLSIQLTTVQSKKGFEILSSLLSFTKAYGTFFHQGSDLFDDLKPHISEIDEYLSNIRDEHETLIRNLPSKHLMVSNNELKPLCFDNTSEHVQLEGYLLKRASNGFKVWNRRWFILKDHQLLYQKRGETQPTVMEEDLRLLTVRPIDKADNDRRFCFEVLSPHKSHILQADSESACKTWISAIQAGINAAFHDTDHTDLAPRLPNQNEPHHQTASSTATPSSGSWLSFKSLQQQATNKLNSIAGTTSSTSTNTSESKQNQYSSSNRMSKDKLNLAKSGDDEDMNDDQGDDYKLAGRSYVPLKAEDYDDEPEQEDEDDDFKNSPGNQIGSSYHSMKPTYPAPARPHLDESKKNVASNAEAPEKPQRAYMIILAMPGNDTCADCGAAQPRWASINLGITLCIECAGIHRSLGVHLSKVRSLTLDTEVWSPEIVQLMLSLGNTSVNSAYLATYRGQVPPIEPDCSREERENWIKGKYLLKSFMRAPGVDTSYVEEEEDSVEYEKQSNLKNTGGESSFLEHHRPRESAQQQSPSQPPDEQMGDANNKGRVTDGS